MPAERTEAQLVLDGAFAVALHDWGKLYITVDNILDERSLTARRPVGARPGVPRLWLVGYKNTF